MKSKKQLKNEYKQSPTPIGLFLIRNIVNEKVLLVAGKNLPGLLNRHRFQLEHGSHPNDRLQAEWNQFGGNNFEFEIVDQLEPVSGRDQQADLDSLFELWLDKLQSFGDRGYNEHKPTREELLRQMAARRSQD